MTKNQAIYSLHINASSVYILKPSGAKNNFGIQNVPDPIFPIPKKKKYQSGHVRLTLVTSSEQH